MIKHLRLLRLVARLWGVRRSLKQDPTARLYTDVALTPVSDDDYKKLEMFSVTDAALNAVKKVRAKRQPLAG